MKKGFTLIEFLVGMTMTALVFIVATNLVITILRVDSKSQRNQDMEQVKSDVSSELTNTMQWAAVVDFANGELKVDANTYSLQNGLFMKNGKPLTSTKVVLSDFSVKRLSVVAARTTPSSGTGLLGYYYDNNNLTDLKATRIDPQVEFTWGMQKPTKELNDTGYSIRWAGQIEAPTSGLYTFYTQSNSGTRLRVNNMPVFDNWLGSGQEAKGTISLTKGKLVDLTLEYQNNRSNSNVSLLWSGPSVSKEVLPSTYLYPEESQSGYQIDLKLSNAEAPDSKDVISLFIAPRVPTGQSVTNEP